MVGKSLRAWRLPFSSKQRATFVRDTSYFLFLFAACGIPAIVFVNDNVCRLQEIKGSSMYPYLNKDFNTTTKHDLGLVWKYRAMEDIERGMIVCLWSPYHPDVRTVKRVIALEGDKVYTKDPYPHPTCQVPPGHVWVEGDGRHMGKDSLDSNYYGPVSKSLIFGKMTWIIWPWSSAGRVRWEDWRPKTVVLTRKQRVGLMWE